MVELYIEREHGNKTCAKKGEEYNTAMLISNRGFRAFTEYDLDANLQNFITQLRKEIEADSSITTTDEEEYVRQKVVAKTLTGIEFDTSNIAVTQREEEIPSRYFPSGFMIDEGESYPKPIITFHIPFTGDEQFLHCKPSTMLMVSDEVDVESGHVIFDIINFSNNAEQVAKQRDEVVGHLTQKAGFLNKDIVAYNGRLEGIVRDALRNAKTKHKDQSDFLGKLGNKPKNG